MMYRYILFLALVMSGVSSAEAQEYYLSTYIGDGTFDNKFRPQCWDQSNAGWIDLRPDASVVTGLALCKSDVKPARAGVVGLGNGLGKALPPILVSTLGAVIGKPIVSTDIQGLIQEIVVPLLAIPKDGRYKIYLGGSKPEIDVPATLSYDIQYKGIVVALQQRAEQFGQGILAALETASAWATTLATENFNCANSSSLTCVHTWSEPAGGNWSITTNQATVSSSVTNVARNDSDLATSDMSVSATMVSVTRNASSSFSDCGVIARKDSTGTRTFYGFAVDLENTGDANGWLLYKEIAASFTQLGTRNDTDWAANDVAKITAVSNAITGLVNGTIFVGPVTDTSITTNTRTGLEFSSTTAASTCTVDDFNATDIAAGTGPLRRRMMP